MEKIKKFAVARPFLFGLIMMTAYVVLGTLTYPVHFLFPENELWQLYGDALSKFIIFLFFLFVLWRFNWISASRIAQSGSIYIWLIFLLIVVYKVPLTLYAFTGDPAIQISNSPFTYANIILSLQTSLVEETIFRGLVLVAMITAWGKTRKGQIKAIILSSLFFGIMHMANILIRPVGMVVMQAIIVSLPGILYATIVLLGKSLWPAIATHWITNALLNSKLIGNEKYQETFTMWIWYAVVLIPIVIVSFVMIRKLPEPYQYENKSETF